MPDVITNLMQSGFRALIFTLLGLLLCSYLVVVTFPSSTNLTLTSETIKRDSLEAAVQIWISSSDGDDNNTGTPALPFQTLGRALAVQADFLEVYIQPGSYEGPGNEFL